MIGVDCGTCGQVAMMSDAVREAPGWRREYGCQNGHTTVLRRRVMRKTLVKRSWK